MDRNQISSHRLSGGTAFPAVAANRIQVRTRTPLPKRSPTSIKERQHRFLEGRQWQVFTLFLIANLFQQPENNLPLARWAGRSANLSASTTKARCMPLGICLGTKAIRPFLG